MSSRSRPSGLLTATALGALGIGSTSFFMSSCHNVTEYTAKCDGYYAKIKEIGTERQLILNATKSIEKEATNTNRGNMAYDKSYLRPIIIASDDDGLPGFETIRGYDLPENHFFRNLVNPQEIERIYKEVKEHGVKKIYYDSIDFL